MPKQSFGMIRSRFKALWQGIKRHRYKLLTVFLGLSVAYYFCLPRQLFNDPTSTVLFDTKGRLLGAKIATDGQWRFPEPDSLPQKFVAALLTFEDKRFYRHWGIDVWALGRAVRSNFQSGKRVSGASTLTMQVIRLSRGNPPRTFWEKGKEMILATRLECSYSKEQILKLYAAHAPFGGNVVGLEAAAWRYFGRSAHQLSWAEAAMLAVLPNSPALIHLSKNRVQLKAKRDALLQRLWHLGKMDSTTCQLAQLEPIPDEPKPLPQLAPHLLERAHREYVLSKRWKNGILNTTLDADLQSRLMEIANAHHEQLSKNEIHNLAILVTEVGTGNVLAYIGNAPNAGTEQQRDVDIIPSPRSSGSILKPFLYAAMLSDGECLPQQLYPDVPVQFKGYSPKNYELSYQGAVPAAKMVAASLNVPSVYMLQQYGIGRFHQKLKDLGAKTLRFGPEHYGLTLIIGGAETSLWDLGGMYTGMARSLGNFYAYSGRYEVNNYRPVNYLKPLSKGRIALENQDQLQPSAPLTAGAIWHTFEAMQEVVRPEQENAWRAFASSSRVAWKTGTSFGFRDAWAVGCTPRYVVSVWVGNADGEGRPGLIGVVAAAPILFDVFHVLGNPREWFKPPYDEMRLMEVCRQSGHLAGEYCSERDSLWLYQSAKGGSPCPYHQTVNLSSDGQYRVHSDCESPSKMRQEVFFILPTAQENFYTKQHPSYRRLPPLRPDCQGNAPSSRQVDLIYPNNGLVIHVPRNLNEEQSKVVFRAAHRNVKAVLYWHLNDQYLGQTETFHQWSVSPKPGKYKLTVVDEQGESVTRFFEIE
jgi:penicillin-binding protein 1C